MMNDYGFNSGAFAIGSNPWEKNEVYTPPFFYASPLPVQRPIPQMIPSAPIQDSPCYPVNDAPIMSPSVMPRQCDESELVVREVLAGSFGLGSIAAAIAGICTGNIGAFGSLAVLLGGACAGSILLDSETSLKLETDNGYSFQFDRRL